MPIRFYGVGDEAFVCTDVLLTPWSGRSLSRDKDSFSFYLSAMRQCIERAFGVFVARWGIFRRPLTFGASEWGLVAGVCAKLHNFCIRQGEGKSAAPFADDIQVGDEEIVVQNIFAGREEGVDEKRTGKSRRSSRRRKLADAIVEWCQVRPNTYLVQTTKSFVIASCTCLCKVH